jgi:1-pyrroline-5-carboxylate dehydrogenase
MRHWNFVEPFGGSRSSGTNDKAGSSSLVRFTFSITSFICAHVSFHNKLHRFVNVRTIKENYIGADSVLYPSNLP